MASRRLQLKKQLVEKILIANLQVQDAVARIEREIEEEEEEEEEVVVVVVVVTLAPAVATKALKHLSVFIETIVIAPLSPRVSLTVSAAVLYEKWNKLVKCESA